MSNREQTMEAGQTGAAVSSNDVCEDIEESISVPDEHPCVLLYIGGQNVQLPLAPIRGELAGTSRTPPVAPTPILSQSTLEAGTVVPDEHCAGLTELKELPVLDTVKTVFDYSANDLTQKNAVANHFTPSCVPIIDRIYNLLYKATNTNVIISIGQVKFDCQKIILLVYSEYFSNMKFLPNEVVLQQEDCPAHAFQLLYWWMISDNNRMKCFGLDQLVPLWLAAQHLQVVQLLRQIWFCFDQLDNINEDIALAIYESAICYGGKAVLLQELMLSHITKIFLPIVASKRTWIELSEQQVFDMLTKAHLAVNSEVEIFLSILYWLEHDWPARNTSAVRLLGTVRFRLFPIWYLTSVVFVETSKFVQRVFKIDDISKMIESATIDVIAIKFMQSKTVVESIKFSMAESSKPRYWIVDPQCSHHHMRHCANFKYPKYKLFKSYLRQVRERKSTYCNSLLLPELAYSNSMNCCNKEPSSLPKCALNNTTADSN